MNAQDKVIQTEELEVERKRFVLSLRENHRGRYLRVTEQVGKNHNTVIVPATGIAALIQKLATFQVNGSRRSQPASLPAASD